MPLRWSNCPPALTCPVGLVLPQTLEFAVASGTLQPLYAPEVGQMSLGSADSAPWPTNIQLGVQVSIPAPSHHAALYSGT